MKRARLLLLVSLLPACGTSEPPLHIDLPELSSFSSYLIALKDSAGTQLYAGDLKDEGAFAPLIHPLNSSGALELELLLYETSISSIGLSAGLVEEDEAAEDSIPTPVSIQTSQVLAFKPLAWQEQSEVSTRLAGTKVKLTPPCISFRQRTKEVPEIGAPHSGGHTLLDVSTAEKKQVMVLSDENGIYVFNKDLELRQVYSGPQRFTVTYRDELGDLWFGDYEGGVWRGNFLPNGDLDIQMVSQVRGGYIRRLAGSHRSKTDYDQHVVVDRMTVKRWDGTQWGDSLASFPDEYESVRALFHYGPEHAAVGFHGTLLYHDLKGNRSFRGDLPGSTLKNGAYTDKYIPGYGAVIGTRLGELLVERRPDGGFIKLQGAPFAVSVWDITPYEDAFAYIDDRGNVVQFNPRNGGFCEGIVAPYQEAVDGMRIVSVGKDLVVQLRTTNSGTKTPILVWMDAL